jgi:hypothetical protein
LTFGWAQTNGVDFLTSSSITFAVDIAPMKTISAACRRARYRSNLLRFDLPLKQTVKELRCIYDEQDL